MENEEVKDDSTTTEETKTEKYLVIFSDNTFGFNDEEIDGATNIVIEDEDYHKFFDLQSQGKQFKLKTNATGTGLFDYIEEYTQTNTNVEVGATKEEKLNNKILSLQATIIKMQFNSCIFNYKNK